MELDVREIEREQRWEMDAVQRGIQRYRAASDEAERRGRIGDTGPGMRLTSAVMSGLVGGVVEAREEAMAGFGSGARNMPSWWMPILCVQAEKVAYISIRTALAHLGSGNEARTVAKAIGKQVEIERRFDLFKEHERVKEKEQRDAGAERPENVFKLMKTYARTINPRTFKRWEKKAADFDVAEWSDDTRISFGMKMIQLLVDHGGGWFQVKLVTARVSRHHAGIKRSKYLELTPEANAFVADQKVLEEIARPWLVPMICPPRPWVRD